MRIIKENTAAIVIDIQERLFPHMYESEKLLQNCQKLIDGLHVLTIPIIATQQYTKVLDLLFLQFPSDSLSSALLKRCPSVVSMNQ
jgi:hypothetical protein